MRRNLVTTGQLQLRMAEDGISGVTSNPTIFEKAISAGSEYDAAIDGILCTSPDIDCSNWSDFTIGHFRSTAVFVVYKAAKIAKGNKIYFREAQSWWFAGSSEFRTRRAL